MSSSSDSSQPDDYEIVHVPNREESLEEDPPPTIPIVHLHIGPSLGRGTFGECFKAQWVPRGRQVALKRGIERTPDNGHLFEASRGMITNEICVLHQLSNDRIIEFYGSVYDPNKPACPAFVMEYLELGSIYDCYVNQHLGSDPASLHFLRSLRSPEARLELCFQVAEGVDYLHKAATVHGDLSCNNVGLTHLSGSPAIKIFDYGSSAKQDVPRREQIGGTDLYSSPEVYARQACTSASDVFSFAMVGYFIKYLRHPFLTVDHPQALIRAGRLMHGLVRYGNVTIRTEFAARRPEIDPRDPFDMEILAECWKEEPDLRLTMREVMDRLERLFPQRFPRS